MATNRKSELKYETIHAKLTVGLFALSIEGRIGLFAAA
jgi:hypothetical protein